MQNPPPNAPLYDLNANDSFAREGEILKRALKRALSDRDGETTRNGKVVPVGE